MWISECNQWLVSRAVHTVSVSHSSDHRYHIISSSSSSSGWWFVQMGISDVRCRYGAYFVVIHAWCTWRPPRVLISRPRRRPFSVLFGTFWASAFQIYVLHLRMLSSPKTISFCFTATMMCYFSENFLLKLRCERDMPHHFLLLDPFKGYLEMFTYLVLSDTIFALSTLLFTSLISWVQLHLAMNVSLQRHFSFCLQNMVCSISELA